MMGAHSPPLSMSSTNIPSSYEPYEPEEPTFDEEEPDTAEHDEAADQQEDAVNEANGVNGRQVVAVNDPNQAKPGEKKAVVKEKKIPNEKRSTTPYMTKYERARVLGTRALQIRFVQVDAGELLW